MILEDSANARKRIPAEIRLFTFAVDNKLPYYADFAAAARRAGLVVIEGVPEAVQKTEQEGIITRAADQVHWNEEGHGAAGR